VPSSVSGSGPSRSVATKPLLTRRLRHAGKVGDVGCLIEHEQQGWVEPIAGGGVGDVYGGGEDVLDQRSDEGPVDAFVVADDVEGSGARPFRVAPRPMASG
jgi:hypothetical protein